MWRAPGVVEALSGVSGIDSRPVRKNMAPVYDFRHVELDKIGRGKRIVKPPGGNCSDIFGVDGGSPSPIELTPKKTKNYMQSTIFSPDSVDSSPYSNGHTPTTPVKLLDTQNRLFGESEEESTPRRVVNRQRSSIFEEEVGDSRPRTSPVARRDDMNPITGMPLSCPSTPNGETKANGYYRAVNGTNGHTNGYTNGHSTPASPVNGSSPRVRNPPGGKSSGIF